MGDLRLSGAASGLDTSAIITQLMAIERRPITIFQNTQAKAQAKIDLFRQINTKLIALQRAADKVKIQSFNPAVAGSITSSDTTKLTATTDGTAASGTYAINIASLAKQQITGGGIYTAPVTSLTNSDPTKYTATITGAPASGTYNVNVVQMARAQVTGAGTFNAPALSATEAGGKLTGVAATSAAAVGTNTYALTNIQHFKAEITRGSGSTNTSINAASVGNLTLTKADGSSVTIALTTAENSRAKILAKIKAQSDAFGITTTLDGSNRLTFTGSDGGDFTITGTAGTLSRLRVNTTTTTQAAAHAQVTVGGVTKTASGDFDTFTAADLGLPGVSFGIAAATANGASTTLTVKNTTGSVRITDTAAGTFKDIAVTAGMTNANVRDAINAAGSGMTAALNGSGNLVLTGDTPGKAFTIADTAGGNAIAASLGIDSASKTTQTALQGQIKVNGGATISANGNHFVDPITGLDIDTLATGSSTLTVANSAGSLRITKTSDGTYTDVAITSGMTVAQAAAAINAAGSGMTASVSSGKLVLKGDNAGDAFTVTDAAGGNTLATQLGIDSATKTTQTASLGSYSIDGGPAQSVNNNHVTGALPGVDLDLVGTGSATLTVVAGAVVTPADEAAKKATLDAIKDLVTTFNDTLSFIKQNVSYNSATKTAGALIGDSMAGTLQSGLTRMFADIVDDTAAFRSASAAGLTLQRDGSISLDETQLKTSLETNASALKDLFTREDGVTYNDVNGNLVKVNSTGRAAGAAGDGVANRLSAYVDMLVSNSSLYNVTDASGARSRGALLNRVDSLTTQISDLDKRIEDYTDRLSAKEQVLRAKFTAMEKAIAMLHNQGNYMSSQIYSLPSFSNSSGS